MAKATDSGDKGWPQRLQLYRIAIAALAPGDDDLSDPPAVASYREVYGRMRRELNAEVVGVTRRLVEVEATSRLLLHPASNSTVTEGTVLLHHTYGVPYLPGSALKGILRRRLRELETAVSGDAPSGPWSEELLGRAGPEGRSLVADALKKTKALASLIDFRDALWVPMRPARVLPGWSPLALDIVNPHHPAYYTKGAEGVRSSPCDGDEPSLVHRLTGAPGCRFLIALEAGASPLIEPWLDWLVDQALLPALAEGGIGSASAAGYGRFRRVVTGPSRPESRALPAVPSSDWKRAYLFRIASSGELVAVLPDGRRASARGAAAQELVEGLPAALRERLRGKKRREEVVEVRTLPEGLAWKLVAVRSLGEGE